MGKSSFYNNINFLKEDIQDAINELNGRGLISDKEAEEIIYQALMNKTNWREDLDQRDEAEVNEIRKDGIKSLFEEKEE